MSLITCRLRLCIDTVFLVRYIIYLKTFSTLRFAVDNIWIAAKLYYNICYLEETLTFPKLDICPALQEMYFLDLLTAGRNCLAP